MALHGDIRVNHCKIGEWWAVCQPGKDGIHPYRWGATLNGVTVRGVLTHNRADGALVLASKVTAAAAEATRAAESPATPDRDSNPPQGRTKPAVRHGFTPGRFAPDSCQVMLARYPCPYSREQHGDLPPEDIDVFGRQIADPPPRDDPPVNVGYPMQVYAERVGFIHREDER